MQLSFLHILGGVCGFGSLSLSGKKHENIFLDHEDEKSS
jgi:hypothetical protein